MKRFSGSTRVSSLIAASSKGSTGHGHGGALVGGGLREEDDGEEAKTAKGVTKGEKVSDDGR